MARRYHTTTGELNYILEVFGDTLATQQGYKGIDGMEAIYCYLIQKHHWLPREVRSMAPDDLRLALHVEMQGWALPPEALR
ncbi:hypothetical protein [Chitiniphilus eburneus]|uniref:hypothetical protein n=1 Tax=Chitiniphilus eburneus TaxID=2571148 RepID=UPI0035CED495